MKDSDSDDLVRVDDFILETGAYDERGQLDHINYTRAIGAFIPRALLERERNPDLLG